MKSTQEPLISVVVPVYGTEKYLKKCIQSILTQTYKKLELIIVNDATKDNSETIIKEFLEADDRVKYVKHTKNRGLFQARISGAEQATGDYISFVDSDDYISCDWYRMLAQKAVDTDADIVAGDWAYEYEDGKKEFLNLDNLRIQDLDLKGDEIMNAFMRQRGLCFSWHTVWNKIYKKTLWDKCMPHFYFCSQERPHLTMCEDVAFSSALWSNAEHVVNVHGAYYFYFMRANSAVNSKDDIIKFKEKINDVKFVFGFFKKALQDRDIYEKYEKYYSDFRKRYASFWYNNALRCSSPDSAQPIYDEIFGDCGHEKIASADGWISTLKTQLKAEYEWCEDIKYGICSPEIKYISFDMFDTLVCRPFWKPEDLFELMDKEFNKLMDTSSYISFKDMRVEAEFDCRQLNCGILGGIEDITLDDIYDYISENYCVSKEICQKLKELEISLEIKYNNTRKAGKSLFELSKSQGKTIIITSDMYLPKSVIVKILEKNGYTGYDKVYVSSEYGLLKSSENLFKQVLSDYNIEKKPSCILHIGDNWNSDIEVPMRIGMRACHLPKSKEIFCNLHGGVYGGKGFSNIYKNNGGYNDAMLCVENNLGLRCMLAVVANKIFDSGYTTINNYSDFNCDPYYVGYYALGMHLFAVAKWLVDETEKNGYDTIHFVSRDGWLPQRAFNIIADALGRKVKTDYFYISRKATAPMQIRKQSDLYSIAPVINIFAFTPKKIITLTKNVLDPKKVKNAKEICLNYKFIYEKHFASKREYNRFIKMLSNEFYSQDQADAYNDIMRKHFNNIIGSHDAFFDLGYGARNESIFTYLLNKKINTYYIHTYQDVAYKRANMFDINIHTFYDYRPSACTVIREHTFCELGPSCIGYDITDGKVTPQFEKYKEDYFTYFVTNIMQQGALDFVKDFMEFFADHYDDMIFKNYDVSLPYEYFNHSPRKFDRNIFAASSFEDDMFRGKNADFVSFWEEQMKYAGTFEKVDETIPEKPYDTNEYNKKLKYYYSVTLKPKSINLQNESTAPAMFMDRITDIGAVEDSFSKCANNTENLITWSAIEKMLSPSIFDNWYSTNPGGFDTYKYDVYLTTSLTAVRENEDLTYLMKVLDRIGDKPLLPIGIGFSCEKEKKNFSLNNNSVSTLKAIAERCKSVGVKGDYSAEILNSFGVKNIQIIGDPAIYSDIETIQLINNSHKLNAKVCASFKPFYGTFSEKETEILKYFAANDFELVDSANLTLNESNITNKKLYESLKKYESKKKIYFDAETWKNSFDNIGFAIGMNWGNNITALKAGVPALFINYETVGRELCKYYMLPCIQPEEFNEKKPIEEYYKLADYTKFAAIIRNKFTRFKEFLTENNIEMNKTNPRIIIK